MNMIFISSNWADAHQQTRLHALLKLDISITCLAVARNYYPFRSSINPGSLGSVEHGNYSKRIWVYVRLYNQLARQTKDLDAVYVFGFDLMLVALLRRAVSRRMFKVVYEMPDIREMFFSSSLSGKILRWIEKTAIPSIDLLVVTSPEFISEYFLRLRNIQVPDHLVLENKIHLQESDKPVPNQPVHTYKSKITIGYFGVLRCRTSLDCLIALAEKSQFEVVLRGIFMPSTSHYQDLVRHLDQVHYLGPYRVPEDLYAMYSTVDVIWAVYPFSAEKAGNHTFARTNRFYESLFFKIPFIVQKNTADAGAAKVLGNIAIEIDLQDLPQTIQHLALTLSPPLLRSLRRRLYLIPESYYQITTEYKDLAKCLQQNR
jgi:succinoglycan biosynthesis protein ExoL